MENRQKLIKLLEECIELETEAVRLYTQHLETPDFFDSIPPGDVHRVKKALEALTNDARSQRGIFETLLARMKDGPKDVH